SFTEKANPKIESCTDAAIIAKMGDRGQIKGAFIDGPLALDVAIDPESVKTKGIKSSVEGNADCLVFPNLEAANISYKLVERLAGAKAIGPLLQGLRKPVNDLSRGCSAKDIVSVTAFTCCQAQGTCEYCVS
ncbi:phosphate acetyltransferase, partial [Candidatus Peregrinibacteria bacterium]|nr:phosphate acetyltransferase [Candidatus Peregrinibacteria bacterium]